MLDTNILDISFDSIAELNVSLVRAVLGHVVTEIIVSNENKCLCQQRQQKYTAIQISYID